MKELSARRQELNDELRKIIVYVAILAGIALLVFVGSGVIAQLKK